MKRFKRKMKEVLDSGIPELAGPPRALAFPRAWKALIIFSIILASTLSLVVAIIENRDDYRSRGADYNSCARVNVTRARVNANSAGIWLALEGASHNPNLSPQAAVIYQRIVNSQSWQRLVPCDEAVKNPFAYFQPELEPFDKKTALRWSSQAYLEKVIAHYRSTTRLIH